MSNAIAINKQGFIPNDFFNDEEVAEIRNAPESDSWFENCSLVSDVWFYSNEEVLDWNAKAVIKDWLWSNKRNHKLMGQFNMALKIAWKKLGLEKRKAKFNF